MLRVAVQLAAVIHDAGEYLADVTALEAAGADAIWVDDTALDPWVALGAMAAVTRRVQLGCLITSIGRWPASRLGTSAAAAHTLSRGRIVVALPSHGVVASRVTALRAAGARIFATGALDARAEGVILKVESPDQITGGPDVHIEVWAAISMPPDRETWARALSDYAAAGATGVLVPWNDRIIDLLRNTEPDDRTDLLISTG